MMYVQPVWRFRGQFADGRRFEVLVQALTDNNLTFGMPGSRLSALSPDPLPLTWRKGKCISFCFILPAYRPTRG